VSRTAGNFPATYLKIFRRRDPAKSDDKFFFGGIQFKIRKANATVLYEKSGNKSK
jgi:hypothetical protein